VRKKEWPLQKKKRREKNELERRWDNGLNLLVLAVIYQLLIRFRLHRIDFAWWFFRC
jgi:hypothetical protein